VFRIKCAGQNNFNTNHFKSLVISGLFKACLMPIRTYRSQRSLYRRKAAVDSFLQLIQATPSTFFMGPPWDSERPAGFDFASLKPKQVCGSRIRQIERLAYRLDAFAAIKSPEMRRQWICFFAPSHKPALGQRYWSFRLENRLGCSQSLLKGSFVDDFAAGRTIQRR
jgi:hypothetical protein